MALISGGGTRRLVPGSGVHLVVFLVISVSQPDFMADTASPAQSVPPVI